MAAIELLSNLVRICPSKLSRSEIILLEAELFARICAELKEIFRIQQNDYFRLMKFTTKMENTMLEADFVRLIIKDILSTEEYNLNGIACYINTHEDVVQEIIDGRNTNPSAMLLRRSIDLHRSVRRDLYDAIVKKIAVEYSTVA